MNVNFTPQALDDLIAIRDWIAQDDPVTADRIVSRIRQTVILFGLFPTMGHDGDVPGTREFKVTGLPYLIVYRISSATDLDILTVVHAKRKYP